MRTPTPPIAPRCASFDPTSSLWAVGDWTLEEGLFPRVDPPGQWTGMRLRYPEDGFLREVSVIRRRVDDDLSSKMQSDSDSEEEENEEEEVVEVEIESDDDGEEIDVGDEIWGYDLRSLVFF